MKKFFRKHFFEKSGEKYVLKSQKVMIVFLSLVCFIGLISWHLKEKPDNSSVEVKVKTISRDGTVTIVTKRKMYGSGEPLNEGSSSSSKKGKKTKKKLKLKAKQVLVNEDGSTLGNLPQGTSAVAELLNTIDSRDPSQLVRVRLLYGLKTRSGVHFKPGSIALGKATYNQGNDRVYVSFFTIINPDGSEEPVNAQALDSKDFSTGLVGHVHSDKAIKVAGSVALNVISAAAGFAQQRSMNSAGVQVPDFNAENALLAGASGVARDEANSTLGELKSEQDYITVDAGKDLIVILTKSIRR